MGMHQNGLGRPGQDRAVRAIVRVIEQDDRFEVLNPRDMGERIRGRESVIVEEGLLATAAAALNTGKGLYNQGAPEDALLSLEAAVADFLRAMPATNTVTDLWEAWVYIGTCHMNRETPNMEAAKAAFQNAAALVPARPLNTALFPPNVVSAYQAERAFLAGYPIDLKVTTDGPATVWVDGIERGSSPVTVSGLLPGEHYIVARGKGTQGFELVPATIPEPGAESAGRPPRQETVRVAMRLPALGQAADSVVGRTQQTAALYQALGKRSQEVDYVLMVGVHDDTLHMQWLHGPSEALSAALEVPYADMADDEALQAIPQMLEMIDDRGALTQSVGAAIPLDVGANSTLASMLLQPEVNRSPTDEGNKGERRGRRRGLAIGLTSLLVAGAAAAGGTYYYTSVVRADPYGQVVIDF
ncbi:MAG: hypothetical protein KTR31_03190 [Myxococcales bacterium]|nr:hypothetical protein [Myxococcales bacterium]